jgi:hypothetical protein
MKRDLYSVFGFQPSGKYGTAEDNSLRGLIALVYYWFSCQESEGLDFFSCVLPAIYGDDVVCAVKPQVQSWFNNVCYGKFVCEVYGMEFTSALKSKDLIPFVKPAQASFLKRTFHWHEALKCYVGHLDYDSIYKCLYWSEPSSSVSESTQQIMTIDSCLRESFFHLDQIHYDKFRNFLLARYTQEFGITEGLRKTHFHEYAHLVRYYSSVPIVEGPPKGIKEIALPTSIFDNEDSSVCEVRCINQDYRVSTQSISQLCIGEKTQWLSEQSLLYLIDELEQEYKTLTDEPRVSPFVGLSVGDMRRTIEYMTSQEVRDAVENYAHWFNHTNSLQESIRFANSALRRHANNNRFNAQMEAGMPKEGPIDPKTEEKHENVVDVGGDSNMEAKEYDSIEMGIPSSAEMQNFLSRPVLIATYVINVNANFDVALDPWSTFLNDPGVLKKLGNFAFLRGKLGLKFALSAPPFLYGKLMVGYVAQALNTQVYTTYAGTGAPYRLSFMKWLSQGKYNYIMDVGDNKPLEFEVPMINFKQMIRLFNNATGVIGAGFDDAAYLGRLIMKTLNNVQAANSNAPTSLSLTVYAYMTDVTLMGLTGTQVTITTESKNTTTSVPKKKGVGANQGELRGGVFETIGSVLADMIGVLARVPVIAPFARAGRSVFRAMSEVSSIFGWSAPMITPAMRHGIHVKNDAFQNAVTTITENFGKKCTYDPLQGLIVDPRICGSIDDELSIARITGQESLLDQFTWPASATPMATILWNTWVHPMAAVKGPVAASQAFIQPTSLGFAAKAFKYWRGTIKYRFQIVRSQLQRGKIAVLMEPNPNQYTLISTTLHLNKQHIDIYDIQETTEFEVCVKWNFSRQWALIPDDPASVRSTGADFDSTLATSIADYTNGFITIFPFTEMQSPDSTASVYVNVFVSSPDMAFNVYTNRHFPLTRATTQSKNSPDTAYGDTCFDINEDVIGRDHMSGLHFGEQPVSFRSYLKRFFKSRDDVSTTFTGGLVSCVRPLYPPTLPAIGGGAASSTDLVHYLTYAYLARRGSVRKRLRCSGAVNGTMDHGKVFLDFMGTAITTSTAVSAASAAATTFGTATFVPVTNGGIEVEFPYYSNNLYIPAGSLNFVGISDPNYQQLGYWNYNYQQEFAPCTSVTLRIVEETAFGDDFTFMHYYGAPFYSTGSY